MLSILRNGVAREFLIVLYPGVCVLVIMKDEWVVGFSSNFLIVLWTTLWSRQVKGYTEIFVFKKPVHGDNATRAYVVI